MWLCNPGSATINLNLMGTALELGTACCITLFSNSSGTQLKATLPGAGMTGDDLGKFMSLKTQKMGRNITA